MDNSIKEKILDAANKVIAEKSLNRFTLEEVAKEAGVSKGGLLYHYPSKDKLIKALIEKYLDKDDNNISEEQKDELDGSNSVWFTKLVQKQFSQSTINSNTMAALLAGIAMNQELLQPIRSKIKERLDKINTLKDPIMGIIIDSACEGMLFANLFGLDVIPAGTREKVMERLFSLIDEYCS